nr:MAG TPA: hypothetical protein [Caudoviricetes sp.]
MFLHSPCRNLAVFLYLFHPCSNLAVFLFYP